MSSLPVSTLPDPLCYTDGRVYLIEWCAAQLGLRRTAKLKLLARFAGCSYANMSEVIRGKRLLSVACARALIPHLALPPKAARHLLSLFQLPHLPPRLASARRTRVIKTVAKARGLPWGASNDLIHPLPADAGLVAALGASLLAYEGDRPGRAALSRAAVPPITPAHLDAASALAPAAIRLAPRLWALRPPGPGGNTGAAHLGVLGFASEALIRLGMAERDFRSYTASVDERGFIALEAACRRLESTLSLLAEEVELRVPGRLQVLAIQRFVAAGPFPSETAGARWQEASVVLPRLEPTQAAAPAELQVGEHPPPIPTGITWFPTWMEIWRSWAERVGTPHSDGWLAAQTGLTRSNIYDLRTGMTRFLAHHVFPFLRAFGWEEDSTGQTALAAMAMVVEPDDPMATADLIDGLREVAAQEGVWHRSTEAHFVQSKWYAHVIRLLADLPDFQALHGRITRQMKGRVEWRAAQEALLALVRLGLLKQDSEGRGVAVDNVDAIEGPHGAIANHELHHSLLRLYQVELDQADPDLVPEVLLFGLPDRALDRYHRALQQLDQEIYEILVDAQRRRDAGVPMDRVMVISRQSFPVFRPRPVRGPRAPRVPKAPKAKSPSPSKKPDIP